MELIDIQIYVGDTADIASTNPLPAGISVFDPYIKWELPQGITQARFAIKITSITDPSLSAVFKSVSTKQQYQIPIGNGFNNKWIGLCFIQIQISSNVKYTTGSEFEYTSGQYGDNPSGFFVIDTTMQTLTIGSDVQYLWQKSIDQNVQQSLIYNLQVSTHPDFQVGHLILNETNIADVLSGYVAYDGTDLQVGTYFFRVRAYDGYDYSEWSKINVFKVKQYSPPTLENLTYQITNNQTGDVLISFDTTCQQQSFTSVILTFCPDNSLSLQYPCALRETSHLVPVGHNTMTWISSQDIKTDGGFYLYAFAYYNGTYSETSFVHIDLQNYKYTISQSTVSDINVDFIVKYNSAKVTHKVYYTYVGWNNQLYIHQNCKCNLCKSKQILLDNNVYFRSKTLLHEIRTQSKYVGWNSQISIPYSERQDGTFFVLPKVQEKYITQDNVFARFKISGGAKDFCLYSQGRNFCRKDEQAYEISSQSQGGGGLQDINVSSLFSQGDSEGAKVTVQPPYQKATVFDPIYKGKIPATSGKTKEGQQIQVPQKTNWTYYQQDMNWTFKATVQAKQGDEGASKDEQGNYSKLVYLKTWGGSLEQAKQEDQNLKQIIQYGQKSSTQTFDKIYQKYSKKSGGFSFPDGQLQFEDDQNAPQYTLYPTTYKKDGYPVSIDQRYWKCVKLKDLYIKKYMIQKGGANATQNGYKDFKVQKRENYYHRFFNNLMIPNQLIYVKTQSQQKFIDQYNNCCFKLLYGVFYKVTNIYRGLPLTLKFDTSKQNLTYTTYAFNQDGTTTQKQQNLYFQQYIRLYTNQRGDGSVQFKVDQQTGEYAEITQSPFCNVAVPKYVPSKQAVFSGNQFNGRSHCFGLSFKIKRDKRRYVLGHYYKWSNREKDQTRLAILNNFIHQYYEDIDFTDMKYDHVVLHYKYKYLESDSVDEISQDYYIYVPVYTQVNGQYICKRAWFKDNKDSYKNVSKNKDFGWSSIDNDDYIYVYRQIDGANFRLTDTGFASKTVQRSIISEGTKLYFSQVKKQNYYSDKSKYGVQSFTIKGDLSELINETYSATSLNEYVSLNRVFYLNHKNVIKDSVKLYYINDQNKKIYITKFQVKPSNAYYNAYISLQQKTDYLDKVVYIEYQYTITTNYTITEIESQIIQFSEYQNAIYFNTTMMDFDTFILKDSNGQVIDQKYYQIEENETNTSMLLIPYYNNKTMTLYYDYKNKVQAEPIVYSLDNLFKNDQNKYVLKNLSETLIFDTINLTCLDTSARDHQITQYTDNGEGKFSVTYDDTYQQKKYKPTIIKYNYRLIKDISFYVVFEGFNTYLTNLTVNVQTIKIYYALQNGVNHAITSYFKFYSNGKQVTSGQQYNVLVQVATTNQSELNQIFGNVLYASYDGQYTQQLYLTLPSIQDERLTQGFDYKVYCNGGQLSSKRYTIYQNKITLTTSSDYTQVTSYLNKPIQVRYKMYDSFSNTLSSFDYATTLSSINQQYSLPYQNIVELRAFFLNDNYQLQQLDQEDFSIDKTNGIFKLKNSDYLNQYLFFIYQYKDYVYEDALMQLNFSYSSEQKQLRKNITQSTLFVYLVSDVKTKTITPNKQSYSVQLEQNCCNIRCYCNNQQISNFYYTYDQNTKTVSIDKQYYDKAISVQYNIKMDSSKYSIDYQKAIMKIKDNTLIGKDLCVSFTYLQRVDYYDVFNNILTEQNFDLIISQQQIDNRIKDLNQSDDIYQTTQIDISSIDSWNLYYQYDLCNIEDYDFDQQNHQITINKSVDTIDQYIKLQYYNLSSKTYTDNETVKFTNAFQNILLKHGYCFNPVLKYSNKTVPQLDYNMSYGGSCYLSLTNRYLNQRLYSQFDKKELTDAQDNVVCQTNSIELSKQNVYTDSVKAYYITSQNQQRLLSRNYYRVSQIGSTYYLIISSDYLPSYQDKSIKITYKYYKVIHDDTSLHSDYLKFQSYDNVIQFNHKTPASYSLSYYDNNQWISILQDYYNYKQGQQDSNATISMVQQVSTLKYFRKRLMLNYSVETQSEIQETNFLNDRSLIFKDQNGFIVLQHNYIDKSSFKLYYQDSVGTKLVPSQAYLLDTGSDQYNGVVVLNKEYANYKKYINKRITVQYKYTSNPIKVYNDDNQKFPYLDYVLKSNTITPLNQYYQGYSTDQHIGFRTRNQPTYFEGRGIKLVTKIREPAQYLDLKFLYLQSVWDAYNTIHIQGTLDSSAQIVLQYGQVDSTGYVTQKSFKDFITVQSVFNSEINYHLLPALTWDVFVNTFDDSVFIQNQIYVLRMRAYNIVTNTFTSQWQYSNFFTIDHDAVNPINITDIEYNGWTGRCKIQFRIDDTQGDLYDLIGYAYTSDGSTWNTIQASDIYGQRQYLSSNLKDAQNIVLHTIYWDTTSYNLTASSSYRLRINATYTKYNQGDEPVFYWENALNPQLDYYQAKLFTLNGGKQYYKLVTQNYTKIQNKDGTVTYQQVQNPTSSWERIEEYDYVYTDQDGQPLLDQDGNQITQKRDYAIVNGTLQDAQQKLQGIKGRPQKTVYQDGVTKTINWGYLEYCDQNGSIVDSKGYLKWLQGTDSVYGQTRQSLINELTAQIDSIKQQIEYYKNKILICQMQNRRQLIRQGYYSNGFLNNTYNQDDPTQFVFKLKSKTATQTQLNWLKQQNEYGIYDIKYNFQLDFYQTFDSQYNNKPLRDFYTYEMNGSVLDITAGVDEESADNSTLYNGNFTINKSYLPGKLDNDTNPRGTSSYSYSYYWRIRPYTQFSDKKYEIPRSNILSIQSTQKITTIQFSLTGQEDLGILSTSDYYGKYEQKNYKILYQQKNNDNKLKLIEPYFSQNLYEQYTDSQDNYSSYTYNTAYHTRLNNNVKFITDRLRDQNGYIINRKDGYNNWISFSYNRQRPQVIIFQNEYYMFYDKKGVQDNNLIYLSLSKDGNNFGEYSQTYPYCTQQDLQELTECTCMQNAYTRRKDDKFELWASTKVRQIDNTTINQMVYMNSDYYGQKFSNVTICQGLDDCDYPSVFECYGDQHSISTDAQGNVNIVDERKLFYVMLCMKNNQFEFYASQDKIVWEKCTEMTDVQFQCVIQFDDINKQTLFYSQDGSSSSDSTIRYLSPFLYKLEDSETYYLYYCVYDSTFNSYSIYRSLYDNDNKKWGVGEYIIDGGFNPTVVQDYYYGHKYQRMYYNTIKKSMLNGKLQNEIVINNCFLSYDINADNTLKSALIKSVTSTQRSGNALNNIVAGDFHKCDNCNGSGQIAISKDEYQVCNQCNGKGIVDQIIYKFTIDKNNLPSDIQNYNFYIALYKKYDTKTYRLYSDWYDFNLATQFEYSMTPLRKWNYLEV